MCPFDPKAPSKPNSHFALITIAKTPSGQEDIYDYAGKQIVAKVPKQAVDESLPSHHPISPIPERR